MLIVEILPNLSGEFANNLELWHLSTMSSGQAWDEHYKNPFGITAKAYYGRDVWSLIESLPIESKPGEKFKYQSGTTQLLGMALIKTSGKPLSQLASDWLWKPLGAIHSAKWHTDENDMELAYCCFNSNVRDFARFGKLMLHQGNWEGQQLIDTSFVKLATSPVFVPFYGYSFWLDDSHGAKAFIQRGILGQYIITIPEHDLVIVRLGHARREPRPDHHPDDYHVIVEEVLQMVAEH